MGDNGKKIKFLCNDYDKIVKELTSLGFKGGILDLEVQVPQPQKVNNDENKVINETLDTNASSLTGQLFKLGIHFANVTKEENVIEQNEQHKAEKNKKSNQREIGIKLEVVGVFLRDLQAYKLGTLPEKATDAKGILGFVLPILAPTDTTSNYNPGQKALRRLSQFPVKKKQ